MHRHLNWLSLELLISNTRLRLVELVCKVFNCFRLSQLLWFSFFPIENPLTNFTASVVFVSHIVKYAKNPKILSPFKILQICGFIAKKICQIWYQMRWILEIGNMNERSGKHIFVAVSPTIDNWYCVTDESIAKFLSYVIWTICIFKREIKLTFFDIFNCSFFEFFGLSMVDYFWFICFWHTFLCCRTP